MKIMRKETKEGDIVEYNGKKYKVVESKKKLCELNGCAARKDTQMCCDLQKCWNDEKEFHFEEIKEDGSTGE